MHRISKLHILTLSRIVVYIIVTNINFTVDKKHQDDSLNTITVEKC